jgi:hypothetical protein
MHMAILICILLVGNMILTAKLLLSQKQSHSVRCSASLEIQGIKDYLQKWDSKYQDVKRWHDTVVPILRRKDQLMRQTHDANKDETCTAAN